ncbi:MAG: coiled coil domain-containing protein [Burkholderiaceae bacterium]|nr:coiled coil domain-containing protein [Burkholderiaceae bacterium]
MASREAYRKKLEAKLDEWDAKLDVLAAKAGNASADARISYENELAALKVKRAAAREKLGELGKRGENAWEDMKGGMESAWDEMGKAIDKVAARFK